MTHEQLLRDAADTVAKITPQAQADPARPRYHVTTPAGWINDPNGPIKHNGVYHLFLQHSVTPESGPKLWAHASSTDLAHWKHEPIALAPEAHAGDGDGVWSGCCVIDDDGTPHAIYTGVKPEVQCLATGDADLHTWTKRPDGPIIPQRPREDLQGFRDPFVWREGGKWRMVIGSGIVGRGGACLLYESADLHAWQYVSILCEGFGLNWECPMFFPLGEGRDDQWVLVVSPHDDVRYTVGTYRNNRFTPGTWYKMDLAHKDAFYAPNGLIDDDGRRIIWGWIKAANPKTAAWCGVLTLPRVLTLRDDGRLGVDVPPELEALRTKAYTIAPGTVIEDKPAGFTGLNNPQHEIDVTFARDGAAVVGVDTGIPITFDVKRELVSAGYASFDFALLDDEKEIRLRVFRDRGVIEVFINGRESLTVELAVRHARVAASGVARLIAREAPAKVLHASAWEMSDAFA